MIDRAISDATVRRLLIAAAILVASAGSLLLVERATGAGASTSLSGLTFASATGDMSSDSFGISTSLAETGWIGRSQSPSFAIHMGSAWTNSAAKGGVIPAIPIPSLAVWGLAALTLAFGTAVAWRAPRLRFQRRPSS
jgi:hypothetical protein